ncbi:MAG: 50S ribosomal protein L9 [Parachlamydiales bacterium]|nr:50S ribosomal protein L9 [Parachlamydiales bacterium]
MKQKQKLLLLQDVEDLGRSGEVVSAKPGYARNFLFPKKLAIHADKNTLRMQERLKKERAVKAAEEKKQAEELAKVIEKIAIKTVVKVDSEGKMYGSVSHQDIIDLLAKEGITLTKKNIGIRKPIKEVGVIEIPIKLKEDVETKIILTIEGEKLKQETKKEKKPRKKDEEAESLEEEPKEEQ